MDHEKSNIGELIRLFAADAIKPAALLNLDGGLVQVNDQFREVIQSAQLNNVAELLDEIAMKVWNEFLETAKSTGRAKFSIALQQSINNGEIIEVEFLYFGFYNQIIALFNVPLDVEEINPYANTFQKSGSLKFLLDQNEVVLDVNETCLKSFNAPRSFFIRKKLEEIFRLHNGTFVDFKEHLKRAFTNGHDEYLKSRVLDNTKTGHYKVATFFDEKTQMYLMEILDRTKEVNEQEKLARDSALIKVDKLAASIAHEIRNPMTSLKGFTQLLKASATGDSKKYLGVIDDEIVRLESILDEMLIMSRPCMKKKETVSLQSLMDSIIRVVQPKANLDGVMIIEKKNTLQDDSVFVDSGKIKQVLFNLIKNALEAMPYGGVLTIGIGKSCEGDLILSIADTGKGIDSSQLNRIFTPYFTMKPEGTGLGLPFVLKTIEEHGGTISVDSEVNKGTEFIILLPSAIAKVTDTIANEEVLTNSD